MNNPAEKAIKTLNNLIEICRDGEKGYTLAADKEKNPEQASLYKQYATERGRFVSELQDALEELGAHSSEGGNMGAAAAGAVHRGWINIKSVATGSETEVIVAECERGEDAAVDAYKEALENELPEDVRMVVEKQYQMVQKAHDRMSALKHASAK